MKILNLKGIGALPVGFKGKIYGYPFKILVQFDAFGGVKAQIYEDDQKGSMIAQVTGRKGEVETEASGFATWAYLRYKKDKQDSYIFSRDTEQTRKERDSIQKDLRKKTDLLIKNLHKEVIDYNKGKDTRIKKVQTIVIAPKPAIKKKAAPQKAATKPAVKKVVNTKTKSEKRSLEADRKRKAMPPGKRTATGGGVYYEYRRNRTDKPGSKI